MTVDPFADLDVRKRCHLLLAYARSYGAIRHYRHERGAHVTLHGQRASTLVEMAVATMCARGLFMRHGASAVVLTRPGVDLLRRWDADVLGTAEPVTDPATLGTELPCAGDIG